MNSTWHSLIWKEWHEHKWKLVSILAVFLGTSALPLLSFHHRDMFAGAAALLFICSVPMAIFVGLGVASSERSSGTLAFAQALPIPLWRLAFVKLLLGFVALFVPILLTVGLFYVCRWAFTIAGVDVGAAVEQTNWGLITGNWYLDCLFVGATVAASFFVWSAATGVNRKDEVSAGAVALAAMVGWYVILFAIGQFFFTWDQPRFDESRLLQLLTGFGLSTAPAGFVPAFAMAEHNFVPIWLVIVTAVATHLALANWFFQRFGRIEDIGVRSPRTAKSIADGIGWLGAQRRWPMSAIVWKQAHESGALVLAGLAGVAGVSAFMFLGDPALYLTWPEQLAQVIAGVIATLGCCIALIVGIGVCLYDVGPQLSTFWRSRPINPDMYFWCKFATGLVVLLVALYVPLLTIVWCLHPNPNSLLLHPDSTIILPLHIALFAAAVAMAVLVRHAVYAAVLSIAVVYLGVLVGMACWRVAGLVGWVELSSDLWQPTRSQVMFGMTLSFAVSTLVAWLAMRFDWGWKNRY